MTPRAPMATLGALLLPLLAACGAAPSRPTATAAPCATRGDSALCRPEQAAALTRRELRGRGSEITVSCEWVRALDEAYRRDCRARVDDLGRILSARLGAELEPVDPARIRYADASRCLEARPRSQAAQDCFAFVQASVPLQWKPR